jgi:hypothetical protein
LKQALMTDGDAGVAVLEVEGEGRSAGMGMIPTIDLRHGSSTSAANPVDGCGFMRAGGGRVMLPCPMYSSDSRESRTAIDFCQAQS